MKIAVLICRILLGLVFVVFGFNKIECMKIAVLICRMQDVPFMHAPCRPGTQAPGPF
jgi:uncharacterized membrane protein YphA (DoxX/SURF4 family)